MSEPADDFVYEQVGDIDEEDYKKKLGYSGKDEVSESREYVQEFVHRLAEVFMANPISIEMLLARIINPLITTRQLGILIHRDQHAVLRAIKKSSKSMQGLDNLFCQNTNTVKEQAKRRQSASASASK